MLIITSPYKAEDEIGAAVNKKKLGTTTREGVLPETRNELRASSSSSCREEKNPRSSSFIHARKQRNWTTVEKSLFNLKGKKEKNLANSKYN